MSEFQRRLAEKMGKKTMTIEVEEYDRMKKEIDGLRELAKAADAIISPAMEILPDTYEKEIEAYYKLK